MKKQMVKVITVLFVISMIFGAIGCSPNVHEHTFAENWTSDAENHWKAATCEHKDEVSEKAAHTFGEWETVTEATEEAAGSKKRVCSVCKYEDVAVIEKLVHTHKYATEWSKDETYHWHAATCEHKDEVSEKAAHNFGEWETVTEATEEAAGSKKRICSVCKYEQNVVTLPNVPSGFVYVKGTEIKGTETWTPTSDVFVSGRTLTIPDLIVSDHEVTRGEYKDVMGSDPSTAKAYDKEYNKLTGDNVLNNPVNKVSWYDAIVYCNKRSMKENLTPCYSIDGSVDPNDWGQVPTSSNSTWDGVKCDFEANGYRLPKEAEWEWLARGGENYKYAGSDYVNDVAWYSETTNSSGTREVKTKAPNGYGLYDMSGNVDEWCWDWYGSISDSIAADGATSGYLRVKRGGSWDGYDGVCQVACRYYNYSPCSRSHSFGFRVVRQAN